MYNIPNVYSRNKENNICRYLKNTNYTQAIFVYLCLKHVLYKDVILNVLEKAELFNNSVTRCYIKTNHQQFRCNCYNRFN